MPTPSPAQLLATINGGSPQSGALVVDPDDVIQLVPGSTVGWNTPTTVYEITAYPIGWMAPGGWTYDAARDYYVYFANGTNGTAPPAITAPSSGDVLGGVWGKWNFRLRVNGGGGALTSDTLSIKLPSGSGVEDVAAGEGTEWEGAQRKWLGAIQKGLRALDGAILGGVGGGVSLGTGSPASVSAAAGAAGNSLTAAPFNHSHQVTTGTPVAIGTANADGAGTALARHNHVHALPWSTVTSVFGAATSSLPMNGQKITGLGAPTAGSTDAATAAYADAAAAAAVATAIPTNGNGIANNSGTWSVKPNVDGSIVVTSSGVSVGVLASDTQHGNLGGGALHALVVASGPAGFMSGTDKQKFDDATDAATADKLALRGPGGRIGFGWLAPTFSGIAGAGFLRFTSAATTVIAANSSVSPGTNIVGLAFDGADGILVGNTSTTLVRVTADAFEYVEPSGDTVLSATDTQIDIGRGASSDVDFDVGDMTVAATGFSYTAAAAAATVQPTDATWIGQAAHAGDLIDGGGFSFKVGDGGTSAQVAGNFIVNLGTANASATSGKMIWVEEASGEFMRLNYASGDPMFTVATTAMWSIGTAFRVVDRNNSNARLFAVLPTNKVELGPGVTATFTHQKATGTGGANAPGLIIEGAQGQDATGSAANSNGGDVTIRGGAAGTGGSGTAGKRGNVFIGSGSGTASGGEGVVVINDSHTAPGAASGGVIMYSSAGNVKFVQANAPAYTVTFAGTTSRTMNAYTADDESAAYTGQDNAQFGLVYAKAADLNAARVALENLRALVENVAAVQKGLITDLKSRGLIG